MSTVKSLCCATAPGIVLRYSPMAPRHVDRWTAAPLHDARSGWLPWTRPTHAKVCPRGLHAQVCSRPVRLTVDPDGRGARCLPGEGNLPHHVGMVTGAPRMPHTPGAGSVVMSAPLIPAGKCTSVGAGRLPLSPSPTRGTR